MSNASDVIPDYTDLAEGAPLYALQGTDNADSQFRLGTREYDWHQHVRGQLFCVESGLVHVHTAHGSWLLPPNRAGWIPPAVDHKVRITGAVTGWGVLLGPEASQCLPAEPCVVGVSELMGALVRRAAGWEYNEHLDSDKKRIIDLLLDEIRRAPQEPLHLPMPVDARLLRMSMTIIEQPDSGQTLEELAAAAGLSARTARRLFLAETGMTFVHWRQQAQLNHALELLARGHAVAEVADALGYATPSSFISMFRRALGDSPASYFAKRGKSQ